MTPHYKYLKIADTILKFREKNILEVGGCSPPELLMRFKANSGNCLDLNTQAVFEFNRKKDSLGLKDYSAEIQDITQFKTNLKYDIIYSINAFEHIHNLKVAFDCMYDFLKKNGKLFTIFGPIWSSDIGHHLSIPTEDGKGLHFFDGAIDPWEHLTSSRDAIHSKLLARYGFKTAKRAITYIYDYPDLNRLFEHDYFKIVKDSAFEKVVIIKNKKGTAPDVYGATTTRELMMILKKDHVTKIEKLATFGKCVYAYCLSKF